MRLPWIHTHSIWKKLADHLFFRLHANDPYLLIHRKCDNTVFHQLNLFQPTDISTTTIYRVFNNSKANRKSGKTTDVCAIFNKL